MVENWLTGHSSWRQTTDLIIQNTGTQQASVTVTFYDSWGGYSGSHQETRTIPANGQETILGTELPNWESAWQASLASAVIESDQPVAVIAETKTGVASGGGTIPYPRLLGSYRAFTSGADEVYMPVAAREYYNYDSSLQVQNARNSTTTFRIKYYRLGESSPVLTLNNLTVGAYRAMNFWHPTGLPVDFLGSAVVEVISGGPVVAMAQYDLFDTAQSRYGVNQYEGVTAGTRSEFLPHVQGSSPWDWTGIPAQNMGDSTTAVTLRFYQESGAQYGDPETKTNVYPESAVLYWSEIPAISGSAVTSSSPVEPIALMVNFDRSSGTWTNRDRMMGYGAVR